MNANRKRKVETIEKIKQSLQKANALVVADYAKITVKQLQQVRRLLKEHDVELVVYKNRLVKRAADELGYHALSSSLTGQNIFAFGYQDDIAPAKIIAKFAKENKILELKAGIFEKNVVDQVEINKVALLPSWEEALTMLASQMLGPVRYIGVGLHQLVTENKLTN